MSDQAPPLRGYFHAREPGAGLLIVLLNGDAIRGVIECDTEAGWVRVMVPNGGGSLIPDLRDEHVVTTIKTGDVRVIRSARR